jgi:hypothetical protein
VIENDSSLERRWEMWLYIFIFDHVQQTFVLPTLEYVSQASPALVEHETSAISEEVALSAWCS